MEDCKTFLREIQENLNRKPKYILFMNQKIIKILVKMLLRYQCSKLIYTFNEVSIKMLADFHVKIDKLVHIKIHIKRKRHRVVKTTLKKKNGLTLPDFKT